MTRDEQIAEALDARHRAFVAMLAGKGMRGFLDANSRYLALKAPASQRTAPNPTRKRNRTVSTASAQATLF